MSPIYVRPKYLILLLILAVTVTPDGIRMPELSSITFAFNPWESAANVLLFFPLGLVLRAPGVWRATWLGASLSMAVETAQFFLDGRSPQPGDVVANTLGALCGAIVAGVLNIRFRWRFDEFRLRRSTAFGAALILTLLFGLFSAAYQHRASLWMWDSSYKLAAGDELSGDRSWHGEIFEIAVFDTTIDSGLVGRLAEQGRGSIAANRTAFTRAPIFQQTTPLDLKSQRGQPLLDEDDTQRFFASLVGAGKFTVLIWCRPANVDQTGPARILTYSLNAIRRNFTLGQEGRSIAFRVRTLVAGLNGNSVDVHSRPLLQANEDVLLAASYDGEVSRLIVNGGPPDEISLADNRFFWIIWSAFVPGLLLLFGALLGMAFLGWMQPRWRLRLTVAGLAGCVVGGIFLLLVPVGGADLHPLLGPLVALFAPAGSLSLLWASRSDPA